jgi:hypothetical protein
VNKILKKEVAKMKKVYAIALAVLAYFGLVSVGPASATLDADVTSLFTAGTAGLTGFQANYIAVGIIFIGVAVISLAISAVIIMMKRGKRAV